MKKLLLTSALALGLASSVFADPLALSALNGGAAAGSTLINFDDTWGTGLTLSYGVSAHLTTGSVSNQYAAPFLSGGNGSGFGLGGSNQPDGQDASQYLTTGTSWVQFQFDTAQKYFGLLWGSVDDYNTLAFYSGGSLVQSFTGLDVTASANGDRGEQGTYYVYVNAFDGFSFDKVIASSTTNSFEIDNVSTDTASHIPDSGSTIALLGTVLIGLAAYRRRA